jgi:hypothetical protein
MLLINQTDFFGQFWIESRLVIDVGDFVEFLGRNEARFDEGGERRHVV